MIELLIWAVYLVGVFLCYVWLEYSKPQVEDNWFPRPIGAIPTGVGACVYVPFRGYTSWLKVCCITFKEPTTMKYARLLLKWILPIGAILILLNGAYIGFKGFEVGMLNLL